MNKKFIGRQLIETDPYLFTGVSAAELGYDPASLDQRYVEWISNSTGQRVGVYVTQPRMEREQKPESTIIMQAPHDYRIERLLQCRMDILASRTKSRVIGVETPGTVGLLREDGDTGTVYDTLEALPGAGQTPMQLLGAARGDFRRHAETQLQAITDVAGLNESDRVILLGESMGAALAVDILGIARQRGLNVTDVVLYEMVNTFKGYSISSPLRLMKILPSIENDRRNQYFEENDRIGHPMVAFEMVSDTQNALDIARKSIGQQGVASAMNGLGMARGKMNVLKRGLEFYGGNMPDVTLVRGADSLASHHSDYETLTEMLQSIGAHVTMYEVLDTRGEQEIGHSHLVSLGRMALVSDELNSVLSIK
jgi:hypothetical protein